MDSVNSRKQNDPGGPLREIRGVGLTTNQRLEPGMMGGAPEQRPGPEQSEATAAAMGQQQPGAGLNVTLNSSSFDPASNSMMAPVNAVGSFKLPNIGRTTHFSQAGAPSQPVGYVTAGTQQINNLAAQTSGTAHHHLNVTLGEEKFYLTAKEDNLQGSRLPNIANQTGSSSRLRTQLGNEYVGLMSKKSKIGSVDFNVQDSLALGGPAFRPIDGGRDMKMLTIDTDVHARMRTLQNTEIGRPRMSRSSNRAARPPPGARIDARQGGGSVQPGKDVIELKKETPQGANIKGQTSTFENYISRVINSVQHRKKNPRLKSLFVGQTQHNTLDPYAAGGIEAPGDYGGAVVGQDAYDESHHNQITQSFKRPPNNMTGQLTGQQYDDQSRSARISRVTGGTRGRAYRESLVSGGPPASYDQSLLVPQSKTTQVSLLGNKGTVQKEPKATEQVAYLLRQIQKKGQIFLPLEPMKDPNSHLMFKENKHPPEDNAGIVVFSKNGFVSVAKDKNDMTTFISNDQYIEDGVTNQILKEVPFFKKFQSLRFFSQWKNVMRLNCYERRRRKLAQNYIFSKPIFSEYYGKLIPAMNSIRNLSLVEIQPNVTYGKKQQSTLEEKCATILEQNTATMEAVFVQVKTYMIQLKNEIKADDERFEDEIKEAKVQEMIQRKNNNQLVMFHKQRVKMEAVAEQQRLKRLRQSQYDYLLFLVFRYWSAKMIELIFESKRVFKEIFTDPKNTTQFEVSICFGEDGKLDSDPTMSEHRRAFEKVFDDMEHAVFKNQSLQFVAHDMNDLFFGKPSAFTRTVFENMQRILAKNRDHQRNHQAIFSALSSDSQRCEAMIDSYRHLQEVHDFCQDWTQGRQGHQVSLEMDFYNETWLKLEDFEEKIKAVPSGSSRLGTIVVETTSLKKLVTEMPRRVIEAMRHSVIQTMEQETKSLKEELGKTSEILDQVPTSLNTYVEQVNTLKYIAHKSKAFEDKFRTIERLRQLCKQENIQIHANVRVAIEDVTQFYHRLPKLQESSAEALAQNKGTMEQIMSSSSSVLSKKIKAFEKKYVETYLHDKSRLDDCGDTLEELFKRSKAIHEIRSKVILYKEFLKLLYENEENPEEKMAQNKLSCAEDFETLQEIHKHTIRLWKILLYWKKRRQMCYNQPFRHLDTQMIIKSIHKVKKYIEEKLPQHEFVQRQSRGICSKIQAQVKETGGIIEFVKDLRRDSLQTRHWMQIFELIKAPHLKTQNKFTIVDLREYNIQEYREDIQQIIEHANTEQKYETIFKSICDEWEKLELKIIPFKDTENSYIMVNTDSLNQAIEENLNTLEVVSQSEFATHIKKDILLWIEKLKTMHKNLEIWIDAQRYWINLDIIYNSGIFTNIFGKDTKSFINTRLQFQRIMWSSYKNSKAVYNLMIESRMVVFKNMTKHFQVLQSKVHEFLEEKRLVFSRFFFLNDSQFLELLTLANTSQDFSMYINSMFVGAQSLYIQPADQIKLHKRDGQSGGPDGGLSRGENISEEEDSMISDEEGIMEDRSLLTGKHSVENSKMGIEGVNDYQVLGMISKNKELFLFEKPVFIQNDNHNIKEVEGNDISGTGTGNIEQWFLKVEQSMQDSMRKQMQYAVKSFATRSLDEWVLDYPQQVVIATINLVLTNEVNEILDEKQRQKEKDEAGVSDNDNEQDELDGTAEEGQGEEGEAKPQEGAEEQSNKPAAPPEGAAKENAEEAVPNRKTLKGMAQLMLSPEEHKQRLHADLFGPDFKPDERFAQAILAAAEDVRQKKNQMKALGAAAGGGKTSKRAQKRPEPKDHVMEALSQPTFYGIFLRIQFWINKVIRSLHDQRKNDWQDKPIDFGLTGIQKMLMRGIIVYLIHHRDNVDKMITLDINDKNDFEWLSKIKIVWNEAQDSGDLMGPDGPVVQCGGWSQSLGAEYLGSHQRLPLTPLTERYFVFASSALREKSGVMFRCNQAHQHAADVFEEFAHHCHMAHKTFLCNQDMDISQLMQIINGAAMAKFWVFFEHLDNLPLVNFQLVLKEIQMVQQQYIIAELGDYDLISDGSNTIKALHISEDRQGAKDDLVYQRDFSDKIINNTMKKGASRLPTNQITNKLAGTLRPSLGVFGSLSSHIVVRNPDVAENLNLLAQSAFRTVSLAKPNLQKILEMILKSEGYQSYQKLAPHTHRFIEEFTYQKNVILYGREAAQSAFIERTTERLVLQDIKAALRYAILLRDQEWQGYLNRIFDKQQQAWKFELQLYEPTLQEKTQELEKLDAQKKWIMKDKHAVEADSILEGFRVLMTSKYFNEWMTVKQANLDKVPTKNGQIIDQTQEKKALEELFMTVFQQQVLDQLALEEKHEVGAQAEMQDINEQAETSDPLDPEARLKLNNRLSKKKKLRPSATIQLALATRRQEDEQEFASHIERKMRTVARALALPWDFEADEPSRQQKQCQAVIEYLRRQKALAIVGPVCTGKTDILKVVAQTLKVAYGVTFRLCQVNPLTFTREEFYGPANAFESTAKQDKEQALKKNSIFQIILEQYKQEKLGLKPEERNQVLQTVLIDSDRIDTAFMDCLTQFIQQSNLREREYYDDHEFLLQLSSMGQLHDTLIQSLPVTLPNGNIVMLPSDLYFLFETEDLSNASPSFISQIGLVITEKEDVDYDDLFIKHKTLYYLRHQELSEDLPHQLELRKHLDQCWESALSPMIEKLSAHESIKQWSLWNPKSLILQFFKILNSMTHRLKAACDKHVDIEDTEEFPIGEMKEDVVKSTIICAFFLSFGVCMSRDLQNVFQEIFQGYKQQFNIHPNSQSGAVPTIFEIFFDVEKLNWEVIQEKLEYKLKLGYYPKLSALLVPTANMALSFFLLEQLTYGMKFDAELNKNFRIIGPQGTSKTVILHTFAQRQAEKFDTIQVPMSAYLSFERVRQVVESHYVAKRKKAYVPKDENKKILIMIDDLHLQSNLKVNIIEFIRTWTKAGGYFDVGAGFFKRITDFSVIMAQNSDYRVSKCKVEGREPLKNRFLFYTTTQYADEMPIESYRPFVQHWLTSKMWTPNKLLQKYYIIITNGMMSLLSRIKNSDEVESSSFSHLYGFDLLARFCSNLVLNTVISDVPKEIGLPDQKDEDAIATVVLYEVFRNYADRIYRPKDRQFFADRAVEIFQNEFQVKGITSQIIDKLVLGNFHERDISSYFKYVNNAMDMPRVKDMISQRIVDKSNNHFLSSILDCPNGIADVYKLSRIIFKEQQHLILCGSPSSAKHECLQIATITNDVIMLELNVPKFNEPTKFARAFKEALLTVAKFEDTNCYLVISDEQIRDPTYIDFVYNYICNIGKDENCILMDEEFREAITRVQVELFTKNKENFKYDKHKKPNLEQCLKKGVNKLMNKVHIVFMISDLQTYHEWISLFPGLETRCEVMFLDDLSKDGYSSLTRTFLDRSKMDEGAPDEDRDNLVKGMVSTKETIKQHMYQTFYNADSARPGRQAFDEFFNGRGVETVYPNDRKANFYLLEDGAFKVYDPLLKQVDYNLRAELNLLMKSRYIMYLEVFRFLYDFLAMNLNIRKNYYDTFLGKTDQFIAFFSETNTKKKDLHKISNNINYKISMIQDKINAINQSVAAKRQTILRRKAEIADLKLQLNNQMDEVKQVMEDKNATLDTILEDAKRLSERELSAVFSSDLSKPERGLLEILAMILDQNEHTEEFVKEHHGTVFTDPEELYAILNDRRNHEYNDVCFRRLKEFITTPPSDFQKPPIFHLIFTYLSTLYRKLNVRNTMKMQFAQIAEIKSGIDSNTFSINYSEQFIKEKETELQQLDDKIKRVRQKDGKLSKKIEVAEISHMRTQHIYESVKDYGERVKSKLERIRGRIEALQGDCIILAASICFLGHFSTEERMELRSKIGNHITDVCYTPCSKQWLIEDNKPNPKVQNKMFRSILKEYGLRQILLPHNHSGIITESTLCETLFHLIFAPSCPLIVDPTGEVQEYIRSSIISKLHVKQIYGSDLSINQQIQNILKSQSSFGLLNDVNSFEKASFGLTQDQSLLHRLSETFYNGLDFNYERSVLWKKVPGLEDHIFSGYNCLNKRMPINEPNAENVSLYQVQIFTPSFDYQNGPLFMAKGSSMVAMSTNEDILSNDIGVNAWMEIKELLLEQINNHEWKQLQEVKQQIKFYAENKSQLNRAYENNFLVCNHDTLQRIEEYTNLKQSIEDIENQAEERTLYKRMYEEMIQKYDILTYYSKVILNMFLSAKILSKIMNEVTYSWRIFKDILSQILNHIIKQLAHDAVTARSKKATKGKVKPQVDIDLKFFQRNLIPKLHKTLLTSVRQDSSAPLFNLIFAMRVALLQDRVTKQEVSYFFKQLLVLQDFQDWRKTELDFVNMESEVPKDRIRKLQSSLGYLYPSFGKKFIERVESELGSNFKYKDASMHLYKLFKDPQFQGLSLIQEMCLGFLCPDHEFKSKMTQFVYQQLSEVFDFSEEYSRFHQFMSRASWKQPIALLSVSHVNMINTLASIAQHYGVGLDVIRTDQEADKLTVEQRRGINVRVDNVVKRNLIDTTAYRMMSKEQRYSRLQTMATSYLKLGNVCSDQAATISKLNYIQNTQRQQFDNPDRTISEQREEDPVSVIERSAKSGSWVLVSTVRFPQFWKKACDKLEQLRASNQINDQFRLIFDLQGFAQNDISDAFLFDHALMFHLTEQNSEEFQGYDDIWSTILDERVLIKLQDKIENLRLRLIEDARPSLRDDESGAGGSSLSSVRPPGAKEGPESPSNIKLVDSTIKSNTQKKLYLQFMSESKAENKGLKFDLAKALEPSEESVQDVEHDRPNPSIVMSPATADSKEIVVEQQSDQKIKEIDQNEIEKSDV